LLLGHVSAPKGPSLGGTTDISTARWTKYVPDVKFRLVSSVYYITWQLHVK